LLSPASESEALPSDALLLEELPELEDDELLELLEPELELAELLLEATLLASSLS
jgi:hypothetical protein